MMEMGVSAFKDNVDSGLHHLPDDGRDVAFLEEVKEASYACG